MRCFFLYDKTEWLSVEDILTEVNWSRETTFNQFYYHPHHSASFGTAVYFISQFLWMRPISEFGVQHVIESHNPFWLVNKARYLAWNCELKTRLSDIVSHLRNSSSNCKTTTAKKFFYNVILKCFQNHCHLSKSQKQTNAFFKVSRRFFLALSWTTSSWRGI